MASILEQLKTVMSEEEILAFDEREFKAVVGLSPAAFVKLLPHFAQSYETLQQEAEASRERPRQRQVGGGRKATLKSMASKQGFILHYFKRYDTLDDVGDRVGFHRSNASRQGRWLLKVLLHALGTLQVLPKRTFATPEELQATFAGIEALVIDATERPCQRPQEASQQKAAYSGKKTAYHEKHHHYHLAETDSVPWVHGLGQSP